MAESLPHCAYGGDGKNLHRDWLVGMVRERAARNVVEVGVLSGKTTMRLLRETDAHVWAVDHWKGVPDDPVQSGIYRNPARSERVFMAKTAPFRKAGRLEVIKADSLAAARQIFTDHGRIMDLVFLDADHSHNAVRGDIRAWRLSLRPGGILCGHDYNWPGVARAVGELIPEHGTAAGGFCWWTEVGP